MTTSSPKSKPSPQKSSSPTKTGPPSITNSPTKLNNSPSSVKKIVASVRPSAEDLVDLERELQKLISRKIQADTNLVKIETGLFDLETEYLTETQSFGNLIHGIEGYLGLPPSIPATTNGPMRRGNPFNTSNISLSTMTSQSSSSAAASSVNPQQRIFSSTSTTFQKSLATAGRVPEAIANGYVFPTEGSSSDLTTINGIRSSKNHDGIKKSSPTKKSSNNSALKPSASVSKNKKTLESAEWQPPSMKSSRKK